MPYLSTYITSQERQEGEVLVSLSDHEYRQGAAKHKIGSLCHGGNSQVGKSLQFPVAI